ncbi:hypothetical protein BDW68DRAFT_165393 [Aspergillus falconensis]
MRYCPNYGHNYNFNYNPYTKNYDSRAGYCANSLKKTPASMNVSMSLALLMRSLLGMVMAMVGWRWRWRWGLCLLMVILGVLRQLWLGGVFF